MWSDLLELLSGRPARDPERVSRRILRHIRRGGRKDLEYYLWTVLPPWTVSELIRETAVELHELMASARVARDAGVPEEITYDLAEEADGAAAALAGAAGRIVAVAAEHVPPGTIKEELKRESMTIHQLLDTARSARAGLAALTMSGGSAPDMDEARVRLQAMGRVARELVNWNSDS